MVDKTRKTFRKNRTNVNRVQRGFSLSPQTAHGLKMYPNVNWSAVVDSSLKVSLYDISRGVPRKG